MTLGRTSSGYIKIKTDGGLRAVECACCEGAVVCGCAKVSATLKTTIESATQITVNGTTKAWDGAFAEKADSPFGEANWAVSYASGFVCVFADNGDNTLKIFTEPVNVYDCFSTPFPNIGAPITINGEPFPAVHAFQEFQIALSVAFS